MTKWMVAMLMCVVGAAQAERAPITWNAPTTGEYACLVTGVTMIWIDVYQTRAYLHDVPGAYETNIVLGHKPSQGRVFWWGGVGGTLLLTGVFLGLPSRVRYLSCGGVAAYEAFNIPGIAFSKGGFSLRF